MIKNTLISLLLLLVLVTNSAVAEDRKLQLGVVIPLTGNAAEYGVAVRNGMTLAQETEPEYLRTSKLFTKILAMKLKTLSLLLKNCKT